MSSSLCIIQRRASIPHCHRIQIDLQQVRHATLIKRPKRPYTFTQLVTLSDGSAFLQRTTSPAPVYRATKDVRNTYLWNPSSRKLLNVEEDEAGKLAGFRSRFGSSWDSDMPDPDAKAESKEAKAAKPDDTEEDNLFDMIGSYSSKTTGGGAKGETEVVQKGGVIQTKKN